jgi:hypothetical protein
VLARRGVRRGVTFRDDLGRRAGGIAEVLGRQTGLNRTERCDVVRRERPDQRRDPVDSADIDEHARVDVVDLQLSLVVREARWDLLDHRIHEVDSRAF